MKHIIGTLLLCLLSLNIAAQPKVVERSAKKMPAWLNTAVDDYLVVSVTAASLAEAQSKVMNEITERIIRSVASNVSVASISFMSEVNNDGDIQSKDIFSQVSKIKSANLPFLKGISQGKIEDLYWEKLQDKKAGTVTYNYSVKYPFSSAEHRQLQREFEALDAEKSAQLKALEQKIGEIEAVEEIKQAIIQLSTLQEYFFDEVRLTEAKGLQERYRQLYNALSLTGTFLENGKYQCQLLLEGNPVSVSTLPRVTSNCASQISVRPTDGSFLISYNAEDCLPEEENTLLIRLQIEGKRLEQKAYLSEAGGGQTFSVVPEGKLILTADSVAERVIHNINVRLTINNRGGLPFGLKAIELHVPELSTPLIFDDINAVYKSKGIVQIKALAEGEFTAREKKSSPVSFVSGSITVVNPQSGAVERLRISLPYVTNWE
jgi:hypothetical protein